MSDTGGMNALAGTESRYGPGPLRGHTRGFSWWQITLASALLVLLALGAYRLVWPASYLGPVRWDAGHTTLTLLDAGVVLDVSENTDISSLSGDNTSLALLRAMPIDPQTAPFRATVIWRPYLRRTKLGAPSGFAQAIQRR